MRIRRVHYVHYHRMYRVNIHKHYLRIFGCLHTCRTEHRNELQI